MGMYGNMYGNLNSSPQNNETTTTTTPTTTSMVVGRWGLDGVWRMLIGSEKHKRKTLPGRNSILHLSRLHPKSEVVKRLRGQSGLKGTAAGSAERRNADQSN